MKSNGLAPCLTWFGFWGVRGLGLVKESSKFLGEGRKRQGMVSPEYS